MTDVLLVALSVGEREQISPLLLPRCETSKHVFGHAPRRHSVKAARKLSSRASCSTLPAKLTASPLMLPETNEASVQPNVLKESRRHHHFHLHHSQHGSGHEHLSHLMGQVSTWISDERNRRASRRARRKKRGKENDKINDKDARDELTEDRTAHSDSDSSESTMAMEKLEAILANATIAKSHGSSMSRSSQSLRRRSSLRKPTRRATLVSSDTDYQDGEAHVPNCDATLDNTKTLKYLGNWSMSQTNLLNTSKVNAEELEAWWTFKLDILRLAHTLKLKGWRQIPLGSSQDVKVERLSGALTNAVYVVSPPKDVASLPQHNRPSRRASLQPARRPKYDLVITLFLLSPLTSSSKLLLRVYGPQAEHLIDREAELLILRRLAQQKIGPRLLGTFNNGRFEQFLDARPLTAQELRLAETSKQIAKRMRELHHGIKLLDYERAAGPFVWQNWDKYVTRAEKVANFLDAQVLQQKLKICPESSMKKGGFICGTQWRIFRQAVERYRDFLCEQYGGPKQVQEQLVFAHNDTQYGNILRLEPPGESPLLLPQNKHRQLVVIDFEYANANAVGVEFANHFTEWCYNYHGPRPWHCDTALYPKPEEQARFIRAYLEHHPHYIKGSAGDTDSPVPKASDKSASQPPLSQAALDRHSSSISTLSLDGARQLPLNRTNSNLSTCSTASNTSTSTLNASESATNFSSDPAAIDLEVRRLAHETRLWRAANSAKWVAWGAVQAPVPGLEEQETSETDGTPKQQSPAASTPPGDPAGEGQNSEQQYKALDKSEQDLAESEIEENGEEQDKEEHFDYLAYAQDRALFFWADCVAFGIVDLDKDLPEDLRGKVKSKMIAY